MKKVTVTFENEDGRCLAIIISQSEQNDSGQTVKMKAVNGPEVIHHHSDGDHYTFALMFLDTLTDSGDRIESTEIN